MGRRAVLIVEAVHLGDNNLQFSLLVAKRTAVREMGGSLPEIMESLSRLGVSAVDELTKQATTLRYTPR